MAERYFPIIIKMSGETEVIEGQLDRLKNPRTVERINDLLPIQGKVNNYKDFQYSLIKIGLNIGKETSISEVEPGIIAYWPLNDAICIYTDAGKPYSPVNPVGIITKNLELLKKSRLSTRLKIEKA
ncbi:MAG: cyclophilin-like fold protein [Candidatus Helarchaeota archaeon]